MYVIYDLTLYYHYMSGVAKVRKEGSFRERKIFGTKGRYL